MEIKTTKGLEEKTKLDNEYLKTLFSDVALGLPREKELYAVLDRYMAPPGAYLETITTERPNASFYKAFIEGLNANPLRSSDSKDFFGAYRKITAGVDLGDEMVIMQYRVMHPDLLSTKDKELLLKDLGSVSNHL